MITRMPTHCGDNTCSSCYNEVKNNKNGYSFCLLYPFF